MIVTKPIQIKSRQPLLVSLSTGLFRQNAIKNPACRFIYTDRFGRHGGVAIQQQNGLFGGETHKYERDFSPRGGYNDVNHFTILDFEIAKIARFNFSIA